MKNKKGFTLIELLAIIVILAIIAVITVPIILNIIENSKMGAVTDSAYGFKDAVNKSYLTKLLGDSNYVIPDNTYTVEDLKTQIDLSLSGKEPASNSWVTIQENDVTEGCLQYDEFKVEFTDGKVSNTEKGECPPGVLTITYGYETYETDILDSIPEERAYLKYTLINGEIESAPDACVYDENYGGELCLKNNEYERSVQNIKEYFGFDSSTWTKTVTSYYIKYQHPQYPTVRLICYTNDTDSYFNCYETGNIGAGASVTAGVHSNNDIAGFNCNVYADGSTFCGRD